MNMQAMAEALNTNFPETVRAEANDRGSLTLKIAGVSLDIDGEGNVSNKKKLDE